MRLIILFSIFLMPLFLSGQTLENQPCAYEYMLQKQKDKWPAYGEEVENYLKQTLPQLASAANTREAVITIPVVVHVIHSGENVGVGSNISTSQILNQIEILNQDYQRNNDDAGNTPSAFQNIAADTEIEFCLASVDPDGNATEGITRDEYDNIANFDYIEDFIKPATFWDSDLYLNIWTVDLPSSSVVGYSYLPTQTIVGTYQDGVVINYNNFGYFNFNNRGRTTTHEVGHYLGLQHTWGANDSSGDPIGCNSDDSVNDTPNCYGPYYGCPPQSAATCGSNDMFMNYMDYTDDNCMNLFTLGQKTVMQNILGGIRSSLSNNAGTACSTSCFDLASNQMVMGFENNQSLTGWLTENTNNDSRTWLLTQTDTDDWGPNNGSGLAVYLWNNNGVTAADDYLFTPCFQIIADHSYELKFSYACASNGSVTYNEKLEIGFSDMQSSNDFYTLGGDWIIDPISNAYPDYNDKTLLFQANSNSTTSIGFHAISDADKYALQIDDIRIKDLGLGTATEEIAKEAGFLIYPNPTEGVFALDLSFQKTEAEVAITVYDILGNLIEKRSLQNVNTRQEFFDLSAQAPGMYFVNIKAGNVQKTLKLHVSGS